MMKPVGYLLAGLLLGAVLAPLYTSLLTGILKLFLGNRTDGPLALQGEAGLSLLFLSVLFAPMGGVALLMGTGLSPSVGPTMLALLVATVIAWIGAIAHLLHPGSFLTPLVGGLWAEAGDWLWKLERPLLAEQTRFRLLDEWADTRWVHRSRSRQQEIFKQGNQHTRTKLLVGLQGDNLLNAIQCEYRQNPKNCRQALQQRHRAQHHQPPGTEILKYLLQHPDPAIRELALRWSGQQKS